jgi:hypothetical protein
MPPPLPLLQPMPPRLSSFRNRSFEVPLMAVVPFASRPLPFPLWPYKRPLCLSHFPPHPKLLQTSSLPTPSLLSSRANSRRRRPPPPTVRFPSAPSSSRRPHGEQPCPEPPAHAAPVSRAAAQSTVDQCTTPPILVHGSGAWIFPFKNNLYFQ